LYSQEQYCDRQYDLFVDIVTMNSPEFDMV
jgi:hypothetical protein